MKAGRLSAICLAALLAVSPPAYAVTVDWDDLTDAQQEAAYNSLLQENESLKSRISELEEKLSGQGGGSSGAENAQDSRPDTGSQLKDADTFLKDLADSFAKRQQAAGAYTQDQIAQMSEDEVWAYRFQSAEAERDFYNTYKEAQFNSLNVLYLCEEYCGGLGKQYRAEEVYHSTGDGEKASSLYTAGYYNRAYALVEFHDYYNLDLADGYQDLKDAVTKMDAASEPDSRNQGVSQDTVKQVQDLLNQTGFLCGTADGICGRQTNSCIERFQVMYGFEPADGLIDDELIGQLQSILTRQGG